MVDLCETRNSSWTVCKGTGDEDTLCGSIPDAEDRGLVLFQINQLGAIKTSIVKRGQAFSRCFLVDVCDQAETIGADLQRW